MAELVFIGCDAGFGRETPLMIFIYGFQMETAEWFRKHTFNSDNFSDIAKLVRLKKKQKQTISVCIPTLNEGKTIGKIVRIIHRRLMEKFPLVDEIIVIDSGSTDSTKKEAVKNGAKFFLASKILKKYGSYKGKGENLWKALYVSKGSIVCFIDGDIKNFHSRFVYGLVGPLLKNRKIWFTKAFYQRPIQTENETMPFEGGRVTEILIRPLFNTFFSELSGFIQPLSGEYAGKRRILQKIPFFTGYGIETTMLIDIFERYGLKRMAQVDLDVRFHRNRPLKRLSKMAFGILQVFAKRANTFGKLVMIKKTKKTYSFIEGRPKRSGKIAYKIKRSRIIEKQRPPIIKIAEYRRKFKALPAWMN